MKKKVYTLLTSNRDCCRSLFYLCNQAVINYDAEQKNKNKNIYICMYIYDEKVTQVSLWLSGENREWPVVTQPSPALI